MTQRIGVVSVGAVTAAGVGMDALRAALADAHWRPPLGLERPDAPPLPVITCASFTGREHLPPMVARRLDRPARLLTVAAREALTALPAELDRQRVGVCAGTWNAGTEAVVEVLRAVFLTSPEEAPPMQFPSTVANAPASQLAILEKLGGPNLTFAEKQASGLRAAIEATRMLRRGRADAALACGVDEAQWLNAEGYERLGALLRRDGSGMLLGEGAAALLLEVAGASSPLALLSGTGAAGVAAAPHLYPSDPSALISACREALTRAGRAPADVDLVVSAANGSERLACLEASALASLFGAHRPAAVALSDRLGEGGFASALRLLIAVELVSGRARVAWPPPVRLAAAGFLAPAGRPRLALVIACAAGGSALAVLVSAPE